MRELTFDLAYERGVDRAGDVFLDHPELELTSLACFGTREQFWRLDRLTGSPAALDRLRETVADGHCCQVRPDVSCDGEHRYEMSTDEQGIVYARHRETAPAQPIPLLATRHFEEGLLFQNERSDGRIRWRIVMPDGASTGAFPEVVREQLGDGVTFEFGHVGRVRGWRSFEQSAVTLSPEQRTALEAAVEHGYYELPREIELDELAAALDVPRSTLSYRLRRAEAQLAGAFAGR